MPKRAGRKSKAQTPAPRKERIYGSKKNPKGSAASEKSASKIKLDDKTMTALKNKLKEFKEKHPNKKNITLNDLKAVYRRGAGAYSKSHRPTITGGAPNTRNAWSMARVNKFLLKAGGTKVKAAYVQDDDLMKMSKGGQTFDDKELLAKWKRGDSIGFTATAHLKAKGLIPRSDGTKRKSPQYKKQGGLIGGFEDLTDEWLSKKIEIFLNKVKPIKFYFVDPNTNTLTVGFDKYYSQDAAQKVYEEATSSKEFFHAPSVESTYDPKTGDLVFKIKLKKAVEYSKGGSIVYSAIFFDEDEIVKRYGQVHPNLYSIVE